MALKHEKKDGKLAWLAWTAAVAFYLYEYFVRVAPNVMEHELALEFSASAAAMAAAFGSYYMVYSPLQLFAGTMFDKFGGKSVLVPACALVTIGCFFPIIPSNSLTFITIGRILAGIGSSCAFIGTMYLAAVWFHDRRLAFLSGLTTSLGILGALLAQAPLALMIDRVGWHMSFMCMAIVGIVVTVILSAYVPKTPRWEREKRNIVACSASFRRFMSGLISVSKNRQTWLIGFVAACMYAPLVVFGDLWGTRYIEVTLGLQKAKAAEVAGMLYIGWLVGSPIAGLLSDLVHCRRKPLIYGSFLSTILLFAVVLLPIKSPAIVGTMLFLTGLCSSPEVICFVASLEVNMPWARGCAIAVVNMIVMLSGILQPLVGWLIDAGTPPGCTDIPANIFRSAMLVMPILMLCGMVASFFTKGGIGGK
jgi:MFS family permease